MFLALVGKNNFYSGNIEILLSVFWLHRQNSNILIIEKNTALLNSA